MGPENISDVFKRFEGRYGMQKSEDSPVDTSDTEGSAGPVPRKSGSTSTTQSNSALPLAALTVGVVAFALAGWAVLRPAPEPAITGSPFPAAAGSFDAADRAAAQEKLCTAFEVVRKGVAINTNASTPGGPQNLAGAIAVGANARLALLGGGQYLLARIDPAAPEKLAADATDFADLLMDIGATSISGVPTTDPAQANRMRDAQNLSTALAQQCQVS
ncbi:hypothetical protein BH11ACT7_BH11ACT7_34020 [soil metagenome]